MPGTAALQPGGVALSGGGWEAALLPGQGAALARLAWRGTDILVPLPLGADPNTSFAGAFVMAPWANRLDEGRLPVGGITYHLPINRLADETAIHGLLRDRPWRVEEHEADHIVLAQEGNAEAAGLPWYWRARFGVALGAAGAAVTLSLANAGPLSFPFGCGWHPFFARPAGTRLRFAAAALLARDARCLPVAAQPSAGVDGDEAAYGGLDTHFAGWDGIAEITRPDLALRLQASGAWARNLQVFAPGGGNVLCVEPVSHVPDAPNRPAFAVHGPLAMLPPGAVMDARLEIGAAA